MSIAETQQKVRLQLIYMAVLFLLIFVLLPLFAIEGNYSIIALIFIPFGIGLVFACLMALRKQRKFAAWAVVPILLSIIALFFIAGEGAVCMIIFGSILLIPYFIGILVGYFIQKEIWVKHTVMLLTITTILLSATTVTPYNDGQTIRNEIIIQAPAAKVWMALTHTVTFGNSENVFFNNGVSYPKEMQIVNNADGGKCLACAYNNGTINAPIIEFIPNKSFSFGFGDSIVTMKEKNIYRESKTMHIQHHLKINYGKFEIEPLNDHSCKLIATSNFQHKFQPEIYTNLWVGYFLEKIHLHVLNAVKKECESQGRL